jgi:hypothetical protein
MKAHGIANILCGATGGVHVYLSYVNSVFYYKANKNMLVNFSGTTLRMCSAVIMVGSAAVFVAGPAMTSYVPRCLAGLIMMDLSVHLMGEALIAPYNEFDRFEYGTVVAITVVIAVGGFMNGIAFGLIAVCATFILQSSKQVSVRGTLAGAAVRSNAFRNAQQRTQMHTMCAHQRMCVVQLQGNLFFANVQQVTSRVEKAVLQMQNGVRRRRRAVNARANAAAAYAAANDRSNGGDISSEGWHEAERQGSKRLGGFTSSCISPRAACIAAGSPVTPGARHSPNDDRVASIVGDTCYCIIDLSFVTHVDCTASLRLIKVCMTMYEQHQQLHQQAVQAEQQAVQAQHQQAASQARWLGQQNEVHNHVTVSGAAGAQLAKELFKQRAVEQDEAALKTLNRSGSTSDLEGRKSNPIVGKGVGLSGGDALCAVFQPPATNSRIQLARPATNSSPSNLYTPPTSQPGVLDMGTRGSLGGHRPTPSTEILGVPGGISDSTYERRGSNSSSVSAGNSRDDHDVGRRNSASKSFTGMVRTKLRKMTSSTRRDGGTSDSNGTDESMVATALVEFKKLQDVTDEMVRVKFYFAGATTAVRSQLEVVGTSMKIRWLHRHMHRDVNDALRYAEDQVNGASRDS